MNIRFKTMATLVVLNVLWTGISSAGIAIDYSDVMLDINGTPVTYNGSGGSGNLQGQDLGTVSSLVLNGGLVKTREDTSVKGYQTDGYGKVTSAYLYYSVWSGTPPDVNSFSRIDLSTQTSLGMDSHNNQLYQWQSTGAGINLSALAPGNYTLGIYFQAAGIPDENFYDRMDLAGNPLSYTANFSLVTPVPEPTEVALPLFGALCIAGAAVKRSGWLSRRTA